MCLKNASFDRLRNLLARSIFTLHTVITIMVILEAAFF